MDPAIELPGLPTDYYAPDFRVEVEGEALDPEAHGDVLEVKVISHALDRVDQLLREKPHIGDRDAGSTSIVATPERIVVTFPFESR